MLSGTEPCPIHHLIVQTKSEYLAINFSRVPEQASLNSLFNVVSYLNWLIVLQSYITFWHGANKKEK